MKFLKYLKICSFYLALVAGWIIAMACFGFFGGGDLPDPPQNETIYAGAITVVGSIAFDTNNNAILTAETHASIYANDLEDLVSIPYWSDHNMYIEYGVTSSNCTDHDHLTAITIANGASAVGFTHNVQWSGTMWLQFVSQCEEDFDSDPNGDGVYYKGTQWYAAFDYPTSPAENIWLDMAFLTNCQFPWDANPGADEYGCGAADAN